MQRADTIAAIATAPGRAGIGVVRVSGPAVPEIATAVTKRSLAPRMATLCDFHGELGEALDRGIALYYRAPHSYTGEDVLELQGHGGLAVLQLVLRRCLNLGARAAQPGEFTQRAFLNDKLDLAQAESVADLIEASSEAAARGAMRSLAGEFSARVEELNRSLIELRVLIEATLDFPEEGIDFLERGGVVRRLGTLREQVQALKSSAAQGRILRDGIHVAIVGRPNVGKSNLLNRLARQEVAIVTEVPGTTRDVLRHDVTMDGVPIHIVDTAGLRPTTDVVERIGIERTWREAREAEIVLLVMDAQAGQTPEDRSILESLPRDARVVFVFNKIDLIPAADAGLPGVGGSVRVSARTGGGMDRLCAAILAAAGWIPGNEHVFSARERHLEALRAADSAIEGAEREIAQPELIAEGLRVAQQALGTITGQFSADDLLGEIFSRFCIGK